MAAQCSVASALIRGVEAVPVTVEVAVSNGMPGMSIVGMGDTSVQEARERVRSAIKASGFSMPNEKIVVNLAPGSLKKSGSGFDLPIALGILAATSQIDRGLLEGRLFVGELSLKGCVRPVAGTLAFGICAQAVRCALVSAGAETVPIDDLEQLRLESLERLHSKEPFDDARRKAADVGRARFRKSIDFKDVAGHETTKRAAQIAVAGNHGLLMMGPPGSGKTMIAERIVSILPKLEGAELLEAAAVHSVAGEDVAPILAGMRPFRHPHHSATTAGLIGGGSPIRPGEVSLAHCGALFLDELPEFKPGALQCLRQPMESGNVRLTRAEGNVVLPARFMLIAAANPCPCGYLGDDERVCTCTIPQIRRYQARIGGPLLDRIDIQIDVRRLPPGSVLDSGTGTGSDELREGVARARAFAAWRAGRSGNAANVPASHASARASPQRVVESCGLGAEEQSFVVSMAQMFSLSGRAIISTLRVARTIADMAEREAVSCDHLSEAIGFRLRDGIGGQ